MDEQRFYVGVCPTCGHMSVQEYRKPLLQSTFRCKNEACRITRKIKKNNELGLTVSLSGPYYCKEATAVIQSKKKVQYNE